MKNTLFILVVLLCHIYAQTTYTISSVSEGQCDATGKGAFDLILELPNPITSPLEFNVKLKGENKEEIQAICSFEVLESDTIMSDTATDFVSDSVTDTELLNSETDFSSEGIMDSTELISTELDEKRRLEETKETLVLKCIFDAPKIVGNYILEFEPSSGIEKPKEDLVVNAIPCLSEEEGDIRANIFLSFRQVNKFDITTFSFMFFALTSQPIIDVKYTIEFFIFLLKGSEKLPTPVKATCSIKEKVEQITGAEGLAPVAFDCKFPEDVKEVTSIEIISSEFVAGIPPDPKLINPYLTDIAIKNKEIIEIDMTTISTIAIPILVEKPTIDFASVEKDGTFTMTVKAKGDHIKVGQKFNINLAYPSGVVLICTVKEIKNDELIIVCSIDGKVEQQALIVEQTVVMAEGVELFVLPAFKTEVITTSGFIPSTDEAESSEKVEETSASISDETATEEITEDTTTVEEAITRAEIFISFRQLNGFIFKEKKVSFNFFALTTEKIPKDKVIILMINLIGAEGMEEVGKKVECKLEKDAEPNTQANFKCELAGLEKEEGYYTSLRLNSSEDISGIPMEDETLLNPVLTQEAIEKKEIKDCSKDPKVPPSFVFRAIEQSHCKTDGKFVIQGSLPENKEIVSQFTIPLTYPQGSSITCSFKEGNIECITDKDLNEPIVIEQTIVTDGAEELFILKNITIDNINCNNGLLLKAKEKTDVKISFRQVSHITKIPNGFNFFFAAFVHKKIEVTEVIEMNVIVMINGTKVEKVANCTLSEAVSPSGEPIQGDFNCAVVLESGEEANIEDVCISTNNDNIGGCAELTEEEASPKKTDDAIADNKNAVSDLALVIDYSLAQNKNKKPPTFSITEFNKDFCEKKGKLKVTGTFTEAIEEEMIFELPFSFPASKVKCKVDKATKGKAVDVTCKMQKVKKGVKFNSFVLEPRVIKKKSKEMLLIKQTTFDMKEEFKCQSYNDIKLKLAKERKKAPFTFLQIARPPSYPKLFFLALTKKIKTTVFEKTRTFKMSVIGPRKTNLRALEETLELDASDLSCDAGIETDTSCAYDCSSNVITFTPTEADIDDTDIAGVPDETPVEANPDPDYSKKESLEKIDNITSVKITEANFDNCAEKGSYTITASTEDDKELPFTETKENINIPFSTPDSSGLCSIEPQSDKKTLKMTCENKEAFTASEIIINSQIINDEEGPLFKISEDYTANKVYSCIISDKLENSTILEPSETPTTQGVNRYFRSSSGGLKGGAIAGIVIACVAAVALVAFLVLFLRKGPESKHSMPYVDNSSSFNRFQMNNPNANRV